jgi:hypothetical protein
MEKFVFIFMNFVLNLYEVSRSLFKFYHAKCTAKVVLLTSILINVLTFLGINFHTTNRIPFHEV